MYGPAHRRYRYLIWANASNKHPYSKTKFLSVKVKLYSYPSVRTYVLGAQKNRLIETVLLSTTTYVLVEK